MNRPPKNMTSVTRNTHIPSVEASSCCSMSSKWCCSAGGARACAVRVGVRDARQTDDARASDNVDLLLGVYS